MHVPVFQPDVTPESLTEGRWMAVIYNNDVNSFDEVMAIVMLATDCDVSEAYLETWDAHTYGKAPVHFACQNECQAVAEIIATIGVRTEVCREWQD